MQRFDHEKLDVYQAAVEFVALAGDVVKNLPRGRADQLQRASTSIPLSVAEGAGLKKREGTVLPYCEALRDGIGCDPRRVSPSQVGLRSFVRGPDLLLRIVSMLVAMVRRDSGSGTGTGTEEETAPEPRDSPA